MEDRTPQKKPFEKASSWKPFIDEVSGAVHARDYRKETIEKILHIIDPTLPMWPGSFWNCVMGVLIGPGFPSGREYLYKVPFQLFLSRNKTAFVNAPLQAIQEFNHLTAALFTKPLADTFLVSEEQAQRYRSKTEQILYRGEQAKTSVLRWMNSLEQQVRPEKASTTVTVGKKDSASPKLQPLFSLRSPFDAKTKQCIENFLPSPPSEHDRQVITLLEQGLEKASLRRQNFFISLTSPKFFTFKDLVDEAKKIPLLSFDEPFLRTCFAEQNLEDAAALINQRSEALFESTAPLLETASRRSEAIRRIQKGIDRLKTLIRPFVSREETKARSQLLINQLSTVDFPDSLYKEGRNVDKTIARKDELFKTISQKVETEFRSLINQQRDITRSAEMINMLLYAARWEIISETVPYPDLIPSIAQVRNRLLRIVDNNRNQLAEGALSLSSYATDIVHIIYEPEACLIRGELTVRSLRLKDLREAVRIRLSTMDRHLALLGLAGITNEQMSTERRWIAELLYKLLAPFNLFQYTNGPESINALFQYWWLDFERYAKEDAKRRSSVFLAIEGSMQGLIRAIARTIDLSEKAPSGGRRKLYQPFIDATKNGQPSALDQWLEDEASTIIGSFFPHLAAIPQAEQQPLIDHLIQIEQQVRELFRFGKEIKSIKIFEPERIDSLLEVLSIFPCLPSLDQPPSIRIQDQIALMEQALHRLDEELLIELGLLDKKSRSESTSAISNLIPQAVLKAAPILTAAIKQLHELQKTTDPYVASIAHFLLEDASQLTAAIESVGLDQERFFETFQKLTFLLFARKMLKSAINPQSFASILLIPIATGQIVRRFRQMEAQGDLCQSLSMIDTLDSIASSSWSINSPHMIDTKELMAKLSAFITEAKRVITTSGLTERREALLIEGLEKVRKELSEEPRFDIPRFSFVPGDLEYFWPTML